MEVWHTDIKNTLMRRGGHPFLLTDKCRISLNLTDYYGCITQSVHSNELNVMSTSKMDDAISRDTDIHLNSCLYFKCVCVCVGNLRAAHTAEQCSGCDMGVCLCKWQVGISSLWFRTEWHPHRNWKGRVRTGTGQLGRKFAVFSQLPNKVPH